MAKKISVTKKTINQKSEEALEHSYFQSIEIEGLGCFINKQRLNLSNENKNYYPWTLILGDNGTGKTTLLKILDKVQPLSISMANNKGESVQRYIPLVFRENPIDTNSHTAKSIRVSVMNKENTDLIQIDYLNNRPVSTNFYSTSHSNLFILSYGASRRMSKTTNLVADNKKQNSSLFDDSIELINAEEWYFQKFINFKTSLNTKVSTLLQKQLDIIKKILIEFLPEVNDLRIKSIENIGDSASLEVQLYNHEWINLRKLSYGYQTMTALLVDIASKMMEQYPTSKNPLAEPVIILIDEIDLHLHPKWQKLIIDRFNEFFPKAQFIVTSHSPLIVQAAKDVNANIVVCKKDGDKVIIDNNPEEVKGWRVDQILISDLFNVDSVRSNKDNELLNQYYKLKAKTKLTTKDKEKMNVLSKQLKTSFSDNSELSSTEKKINDFIANHL